MKLPYITRMTSNEPVDYPYVYPSASRYLWQPEVRLWYPCDSSHDHYTVTLVPVSFSLLVSIFRCPYDHYHISVRAHDRWHCNIEWAQIVPLHRQEEQDPILELFKSPYTLYNIPKNHLYNHPITGDVWWQSKHTFQNEGPRHSHGLRTYAYDNDMMIN